MVFSAPAATPPSTTPTTPAPDHSFNGRVNMDALDAGLAGQGVNLNSAQLDELHEILHRNLNEYEGSNLLSGSIGGELIRIVYAFIYFLQDMGRNGGSLDWNHFGDWMKDRVHNTGSGTEYEMLNQAMMHANQEIGARFGDHVAELATGMAIGNRTPINMPGNAFSQIRNGIELTAAQIQRGTSLNNNPAQRMPNVEPAVQADLPVVQTASLTPGPVYA